MKVDSITRKVLRMILEASKDAHPNEFAAMLRADGTTITELVLVPGTVSGNSHAILRTHMLPIDFSVIGTVHSHPSPSARPSMNMKQSRWALIRRWNVIPIFVQP